jgi:mannose-1-phosphate guanylyltransferase
MGEIKTAFVLGAGLGTRLRPLTENCPKPLLPIKGKPMIVYAFEHVRSIGVKKIIVNTHHCAEKYQETFPNSVWNDVPLAFRHEPVLLETGGGIKNIEDLVSNESLLVYNGDIVSSLPLQTLIDFHFKEKNEVTLALRSSGGPLHVSLSKQGKVCDIRDSFGQNVFSKYLFTGIYIIEPNFFARFKAGEKKSVIPVFLEMIKAGGKIGGIVIDEGEWSDVGSLEEYGKKN